MRFRKLWLILGTILIASALCGWAAIHWLSPRSYVWREVESSDNQFRVSFPGTPSTSQKADKSADGRIFVSTIIRSSPVRGVIYAVGWWENPSQRDQTTDELFAHFRECNISVFHGAVSQKDAEVQGHPAKYTFVLAGNGLIVENLAIRVGPRVYSLSVLDSSAYLEKENIQRFFYSFTLR